MLHEKPLPPDAFERLFGRAEEANRLLKSLANQNRLIVLCLLASREWRVSDLEDYLDIRQPSLSQQLARLRAEGLVDARREGKSIYYKLASENARAVIALLNDLFCDDEVENSGS